MKPVRFVVMARSWNGRAWDLMERFEKTKGAAVGAAEFLLKNVSPYQISITDREQANPEVIK